MTERRAHEQRIERLTAELEDRVAALATANLELEQKSAENESFVYSVSHDLRTPLVNLQGFSQELAFTSEELQKVLTNPAVPATIPGQGPLAVERGTRRIDRLHPQCRSTPR